MPPRDRTRFNVQAVVRALRTNSFEPSSGIDFDGENLLARISQWLARWVCKNNQPGRVRRRHIRKVSE